MAFQAIGADENGNLPPEVKARLDALFMRFEPGWSSGKAYTGQWIVLYGGVAYIGSNVPARSAFTVADWTALTSAQSSSLGITPDSTNPGMYVLGSPSAFTADSTYPGMYFVGSNSQFTPDPNNSGMYLIGA